MQNKIIEFLLTLRFEEVVFSRIAARQKVCNVSQFDTDIPKFRSRLNPVDENIERCNPATPNFVECVIKIKLNGLSSTAWH